MENRGGSMVPGVWRSFETGECRVSGVLIVILEGGVVREVGICPWYWGFVSKTQETERRLCDTVHFFRLEGYGACVRTSTGTLSGKYP
jgi:hypothetical protein